MITDSEEARLRDSVIQAAIKYYRGNYSGAPSYVPGDRIPYAGRVFDEKEIVNAVHASLDFWLTAGKYAVEFETGLAHFLNIKHCSLVNSGSSANLLAFMALTSPQLGNQRIKRGDEVITVAAAFPTTVAPLVQFGVIPVFVDVSIPSYNLDPSLLEAALTPKTKAVFLAHTMGNPFDLQTVKDFCDDHHLWLLEDNCDALGSKYYYDNEWRYTGTIGHMGTSSFYPAHHLTMGEGGAVYTNDAALKRIVESLRDWGRDCWCLPGKDNTCGCRFSRIYGALPSGYDHKYVYSHFGYNLKATDLQAAIGCAQLEKLPDFIRLRKQNWQYLKDGLSGLEDFFILPEAAPGCDPSWFGFLVTVREKGGFTRTELVQFLEGNGIQTRMLFAGNLTRHPCFTEFMKAGKGFRIAGELKNTDIIMNHTFWLGVYPGLTEAMLNFIIEKIHEFCRK